MVADKIANAALYKSVSAGIKAGLEYIENTDLNALVPGVYPLDGGMKVLVSEYSTKNPLQANLEAHQNFIDIQYLIKGEEQIGYAPLNGQEPTTPYDANRDIVFFKEEVSYVRLQTGMFAIFWPTDLHQPCVQYGASAPVKKLVIKVPV